MNKEIVIDNIDLNKVISPGQSMRINTKESNIDDLARSISKVGLINPITVIPKGKYFEVVAGFRRFLAIKSLNWTSVPCIVIEENNELAVGVMTAENYEREDVNTFDEAVYLKKLLDITQLSQKKLARVINRSESYVSERIAILDYPEELRDAVANGKLSFSVARELNKIEDEADKAMYVRYAIQNGCTPDIARRWRQELDSRKAITSQEIGKNAVENYSKETNKTTVMILCKICNENTDVNELVTMYVCKRCVDVLRKAAAL
jgi:ParB family chromosome partitioning protein